ncbi:hypothetical protein BCR33DRAFT_122177 [Rhizoclosmatium globosum]|uniref:Uncharacterized protein n=1 Tax=Rhizoclosmatium globosum TaxID=329046 RepID=A0A1Y2ANW7_9FUNG|nr:hypothetical protein BCR33DRAFT_122177 [Rhizoclosmatium globosum]|eukprot:ORY23645.1 hypothetical protein BCR33DRAFT_122177 [Rhizoclosmatium globosum]
MNSWFTTLAPKTDYENKVRFKEFGSGGCLNLEKRKFEGSISASAKTSTKTTDVRPTYQPTTTAAASLPAAATVPATATGRLRPATACKEPPTLLIGSIAKPGSILHQQQQAKSGAGTGFCLGCLACCALEECLCCCC